MPHRFTIRYRSTAPADRTALIVEDEDGTAYLFSRGTLHRRLAGAQAPERLRALLHPPTRWTPVPTVPPYTLVGLRHLTGTAGDSSFSRHPPAITARRETTPH